MAKGKGQRRLFLWKDEDSVLTTIGKHDYTIAPQPMERYRDFEDIVLKLFDPARFEEKTDLVEWILKIPHRFLQLYIPDITEEDAVSCTIWQIKWLWETIREVNGIDWLWSVLKNARSQLGGLTQAVPALAKADESSAADGSATTKTSDGDGETPST